MGRSKYIELGSAPGGLRVEYLRTRCLLRFGSAAGGRAEGFELGLREFCDELGIDRRDFGPPAVYLLFAGRRAWAGGGTRDMIGSWESEGEARDAFRGCRDERSYQWAELVAVRVGGDCQAVSWFGPDRARKGP